MAWHFACEDLKRYSVEDRLKMIELIWESLEHEHDKVELTDSQKAELDRRLAHLEEYPDDVIPANEVFARIRSKL